jgi:hypothetical protein
MSPVAGKAGHWEVGLAERSSGQPAGLVRLSRVADGTDLSQVDQNPDFQTIIIKPSVNPPGLGSPMVQSERIRLATERPDDVTAIAYVLNLITATAKSTELGAAIEEVVGEQLLAKYPNASVWVIDHDPAISARITGTRVLLQVTTDPSLLTRRPLVGADGLAFKSSRHLFSDTALGLGAFLGPLFSCRAPWVWGFSAGRAGSVIAYSLGELVLGRSAEPADPLQLLSPVGRPGIAPVTQPAPAAFDAAFRWWVEHLDLLFTEMTDPCRHVAAFGSYDVLAHFESLLSVEQAFRHVQSLSIHDRDAHAQRSLLFHALDVIAAVRPPDFDKLCKLSVAKKALLAIEAVIDPVAADVLLPRARNAVQALEDLRKGFFLPSRISGSGLRLPDKYGTETVVPYEQAAGLYLRVLRNSVHGFGGRGGPAEERARALLASHDGNIPADLPDLAYLYLLRLLACPSELH